MTFLLLLIAIPLYVEHFDEINSAVKLIVGSAVVIGLGFLLYQQLFSLYSFNQSMLVILLLVVAPSFIAIGLLRLVKRLFAALMR